MSPYCPRCLGVKVRDEARCPLDQHFLHRRSCSDCGHEMFPREIYCAHCGNLSREPKEALLVPREAKLPQVWGSLALDYFTLSLLTGLLFWNFTGPLILPVLPFSGILYRALGRSGGRQTFGQAVFHVLTTDMRAGPAGFAGALNRSVREWILVPKALFKREAWSDLEERSETMEVSLA